MTVWSDCAKRSAVKFRYNAQRDQGNIKRLNDFFIDPDVPERCQQTSTKSYKRRKGANPGYDRGHLVPANHVDQSEEAIRQTNYMINILPQVAQMNRGAWRHTEEIIECYRDIDELLVIGGALWDQSKKRDYFVKSHGVRTPSAFWKIVIRGDGRTIAWLVPNAVEATYKNLDRYLVTARSLETLTGEVFPTDDFRKDDLPARSGQIPIGCDRG